MARSRLLPSDSSRLIRAARCNAQEIQIPARLQTAKAHMTMLASTGDLTRAAFTQVRLGNFVAVRTRLEHSQPLDGRIADQDAASAPCPTTNPASKLVQGRKPQLLGTSNDHPCGLRHIHADLDDRRRYKASNTPLDEIGL